jgi:hypothetical protein
MSHTGFHLERVLTKSLNRESLSGGEIGFLLDLKHRRDTSFPSFWVFFFINLQQSL